MLVVDVALLTSPSSPILIPRPETAEVFVFDRKGRMVLKRYVYSTTSGGYQLHSTEGIESESFLILVGCVERAFLLHDTLVESTNTKVFDDSLFVNWGTACLDAKKGSSYTIEARLSSYQHLSSGDVGTKVAIGSLRSNTVGIFVK
jgi:hypothetical protein